MPIVDVQDLPVEQPVTTKRFVLPESLGFSLKEGFTVPIELDVTHDVQVTIGSQSIAIEGDGGEARGSGSIYLERGREYQVVERYRYVAAVDSLFIDASYDIDAELAWTLVVGTSGRFTYGVDADATDLSARFRGDVSGGADIPVVGNTLEAELTITRTIAPGDAIVSTGSFTAVLRRTATVTFEESQLPPWDVDSDGETNVVDLVRVARDFGVVGVELAGDVDQNGRIDVRDLALIARHFEESFVLATPARAASVARTPVWLREAPLGEGAMRVDVVAVSGWPVGGFDARLGYDDAQWELLSAGPGPGIAGALDVPVPTIPGVARVVAVRLGTGRAAASGPIASFAFRPTVPGPNAEFRLVRLDLADLDGKLMSAGVVVPESSRTQVRPTVASPAELGRNFPNPFNPETWIPFTLTEPSSVVIGIFALSGVLVRRLDLGHLGSGDYVTKGLAAHWDGRDADGERLPSGVYIYRLATPSTTTEHRMVIAK